MTTLEKLEKLVNERNEILEVSPYRINSFGYRVRACVSDENGYGESLESAIVDLLANMGAL